ncbi:RNA 2'-phosphotransferase [Ktedonospora formicarum]|uniref:Probable RNA 2'-phosphotransferase n=1 Tax=Ktedonospora formicarum TaxID=2778364 RepID=A0A8J3MYP6_9CHLR|nr:RNA 2'-phosphotransferase [Ktedonospora formicarum]GHO51043.1 putative RNA 2'-phosphotransferase [Ktedonospora formicarum]
MEKHLKRLSKTLAYVLRHDPQSHGLILDAEGWVSMEELLAALHQQHRSWEQVTETDIFSLMAQSEKQRFEVKDGKIRAYYGHSLPRKIEMQAAIPPKVLYHGTTPEATQLIRDQGLRPMQRQYVHLSADRETALMVARRRTSRPVILHVNALEASEQGIAFYLGNDMVWLAEPIPPPYIQFG